MMMTYFDYQFRVILIGDSMVGKSSLMRSFIEGSFTPVCDPTIGVDFFSRTVKIFDDDVFVKLQLWDTAGQEKFRSITSSYYRNCVGVVIVFDLNDRETFEHVAEWYEEARLSIKCPCPVFVIVGHKSDRKEDRQVSKLEAQSLAQRLGDYAYIETSSVSGQNVEQTFRTLAETIYSNVIKGCYTELCATDSWDGVKQGQNAALVASLSQKSLQLGERAGDYNDNNNNRSECCQ